MLIVCLFFCISHFRLKGNICDHSLRKVDFSGNIPHKCNKKREKCNELTRRVIKK